MPWGLGRLPGVIPKIATSFPLFSFFFFLSRYFYGGFTPVSKSRNRHIHRRYFPGCVGKSFNTLIII
jgi:hypothetical protein